MDYEKQEVPKKEESPKKIEQEKPKSVFWRRYEKEVKK
jgi:hypothetical protein